MAGANGDPYSGPGNAQYTREPEPVVGDFAPVPDWQRGLEAKYAPKRSLLERATDALHGLKEWATKPNDGPTDADARAVAGMYDPAFAEDDRQAKEAAAIDARLAQPKPTQMAPVEIEGQLPGAQDAQAVGPNGLTPEQSAMLRAGTVTGGGNQAAQLDASRAAAERRAGYAPKSEEQLNAEAGQVAARAGTAEEIRGYGRDEQAALQAGVKEQGEYVDQQKLAHIAVNAYRNEQHQREQARIGKFMEQAKVDPDRFWKEHWAGPVGSRIFAALSLGFIGAATKGAGVADGMRAIQGLIDKDIDAQRATLEAKHKLLGMAGASDERYINGLNDSLKNLDGLRVAAYNAAAMQAKSFAARVQTTERAGALDAMAMDLEAKAQEAERKLHGDVDQEVQKTLDDNLKRRVAAQNAAAAQARANQLHQEAREDKFRLANMALTGRLGAGSARLENQQLTDISKRREKVDPMIEGAEDLKTFLAGKKGVLPGFTLSDRLLFERFPNLAAERASPEALANRTRVLSYLSQTRLAITGQSAAEQELRRMNTEAQQDGTVESLRNFANAFEAYGKSHVVDINATNPKAAAQFDKNREEQKRKQAK